MELSVDASPEVVMAEAVKLWKELRHPRLADLVDRIEEVLLAAEPRPLLEPSPPGSELSGPHELIESPELAAWLKIEAAGDPLDFRRLAHALRGSDLTYRVQVLSTRGADPRLARALLALIEELPEPRLELVTPILEELAATRDLRAAGPADELAERYLAGGDLGIAPELSEGLRDAARRLEAVDPAVLPDALAAACTAIEARFGLVPAGRRTRATGRPLDELLAAVYADPADDGPRLVYADALLEQGDRHGELIALQIARAAGRRSPDADEREAALLADRARVAAWGRPLSAAGACTFERGFPAVIELHRGAKLLLGDPAWATITGVTGVAGVSEQVAARICELPGLRSVELLTRPLLEQLCRTRRPWRHLGVEDERAPSAEVLAALPALRSLTLRLAQPPPRELLAALELHELRLRVPGRYHAVALPPSLTSLEIATGALPVLALTELARLAELRLEFRYAEPLLLPASLQRLVIESRGPLPRIAVAPGSRLRSAKLSGSLRDAEALRGLAALEELELFANGGVVAGALDPLVQLRKLSFSGARPSPEALARLERLEELSWLWLPLDELPGGLPLRRAKVCMIDALPELERFVARYPALEALELQLSSSLSLRSFDEERAEREPVAELGFRHVVSWRPVVEVLERSAIQRIRFVLERDCWLTLERDAGGLLSRLRIERGELSDAEHLARALTRVTSIEGAPAKLPDELAGLVLDPAWPRSHPRGA